MVRRDEDGLCFFCEKIARGYFSWSPSGKSRDVPLGCRICNRPTCDTCGAHFETGDEDNCTLVKICPDCLQSNPEMASANALQSIAPSDRTYCSFCRTEMKGGLASSLFECSEKTCLLRFCRRCGVERPDKSLVCPKCDKDYRNRIVSCSLCNATIDPNRSNDFFDCKRCQRIFCSSHTVVVRMNGKIRNACPECAPHCEPLSPKGEQKRIKI